MKDLTPKQKVFADEWIKNGGNATAAAKEAGYSERTAYSSGQRLLKNVEVLAYIASQQEEMERLAERDIMSLTEIQVRRSKIGKGEVTDSFGFAPDFSDQLKAMDALEKAQNVKAEREAKKKAEEEARNAGQYHTDLDSIADSFHWVVRDIREKKHREYVFRGGRGSTKSSCGTMIPYELLMNNPNIHALALRQVANTLRDSIYAQFQWSAEEQAKNPMFRRENWDFKLSPLEITYKPTGQKVYFRGADDPGKIKSIKVPFGHIGILIFEELDQFGGEEQVRKIEQSAIRGGEEAWILKF